MKDEEGSRLQCGTVLSGRYLLQRLLGKGGFSEVFQVEAPTKLDTTASTAASKLPMLGMTLVGDVATFFLSQTSLVLTHSSLQRLHDAGNVPVFVNCFFCALTDSRDALQPCCKRDVSILCVSILCSANFKACMSLSGGVKKNKKHKSTKSHTTVNGVNAKLWCMLHSPV